MGGGWGLGNYASQSLVRQCLYKGWGGWWEGVGCATTYVGNKK